MKSRHFRNSLFTECSVNGEQIDRMKVNLFRRNCAVGYNWMDYGILLSITHNCFMLRVYFSEWMAGSKAECFNSERRSKCHRADNLSIRYIRLIKSMNVNMSPMHDGSGHVLMAQMVWHIDDADSKNELSTHKISNESHYNWIAIEWTLQWRGNSIPKNGNLKTIETMLRLSSWLLKIVRVPHSPFLFVETMANGNIGNGNECASHRCDIVSSFNIRSCYSIFEAN